MIIGLDSAQPPTRAEALAAKAGGIRLWSGYLATKPNVGLYHAWTLADFENARLCGGTPIAFCSGLDDPLACRDKAAQWRVRLCLDVESGIRADGPWVQPWLDISRAGLYGTKNVHTGRHAMFHIAAWYLTNPNATYPVGWDGAAPHGWQWWNTHNEFGVGVDRGWYDDFFGGSDEMDQATFNQLVAGNPFLQDMAWRLNTLLNNLDSQPDGPSKGQANKLKQELDAIKAATHTGPFDATITPK